jgi:purine-nucleoside phosphorylase
MCNYRFLLLQLNAAVTVQTLIDVFTVSGIVHYGTAGSTNDSMSFGDVSVPKLVAYTGAWRWKVRTSLTGIGIFPRNKDVDKD